VALLAEFAGELTTLCRAGKISWDELIFSQSDPEDVTKGGQLAGGGQNNVFKGKWKGMKIALKESRDSKDLHLQLELICSTLVFSVSNHTTLRN
jgi:hypothetical protein